MVTYPNEILTTKAQNVSKEDVQNGNLRRWIAKMKKEVKGKRHGKKKPLLVGLAAPQVGIHKSIIFVDTNANGKGGIKKLTIHINPQITSKSKEKTAWYEGCWSIPGVCAVVKRAENVSVTYKDTHGKTHTQTFHGYTARIFQHEIDHLNGKLFFAKLRNNQFLHIVKQTEFAKYRNNESWRTWKNTIRKDTFLQS